MPILVPSTGPGCWKPLLAQPEKHWCTGKSARTLAHCWEAEQGGWPPEVAQALAETPLSASEPVLVVPEWRTPLEGGRGRDSQSDMLVLARTQAGTAVVVVEGKVKEPFEKTLQDWCRGGGSGKKARLKGLVDALRPVRGTGASHGAVRYQLIHRTAAAVIECERFGAGQAGMVVHAWSRAGYGDYTCFVEWLTGRGPNNGRATHTARGRMPLTLAWADGEPHWLAC